jgi:glycosyl transferase, family 9
MKILLIRNDNIGDLICTTPAIEALRKAYPDAIIDIVVNSLNECVVYQNPFINQIFSYTKTKHKKSILDKIRVFFEKCLVCLKIWQQRYDVAVVFRTHYSPSAMLFARLGAKRVIAVDSDKRPQKVITDKIKFNGMHEIIFCCEILKPLGVKYDNEKTLYVPKNPISDFKDFVFFHISAREPRNILSDKKILAILEFLKTKFSLIAITAENRDFANHISKISNVKYVETLNIDDLANILGAAKFAITLEGGVSHLAPTLGVKTLVIFGSQQPERWAPIYSKGKCIFLCDNSRMAENVQNELIFDTIKREFI